MSSGKKGPSGGNSCWGSGFLPTVYQGVQLRGSGDPVLYLSNPPGVDAQLQRETLESIGKLNRMRLDTMGDPEITTRINSFEMAFRMQTSAPELMDISKESKQTLDLYGASPGKPSFANNCLLARRMVERGVRFVQLYHEAWDQHGNLVKDISINCKATDQACTALVLHLNQRGPRPMRIRSTTRRGTPPTPIRKHLNRRGNPLIRQRPDQRPSEAPEPSRAKGRASTPFHRKPRTTNARSPRA